MVWWQWLSRGLAEGSNPKSMASDTFPYRGLGEPASKGQKEGRGEGKGGELRGEAASVSACVKTNHALHGNIDTLVSH